MKKATDLTARYEITDFRQIINIGPAIADHLKQAGLNKPTDLIGKKPLPIWEKMCRSHGKFLDPCLLDCIISAVDYMDGNPPKPWWDYTKVRKAQYSADVDAMREI